MQFIAAGGRQMIEVLVAVVAGTLLLIAAGTGRKLAPVPVRTRKR
jgi:hypothetical protein